VSIKDRISCALLQQALIMYWRIRNLLGPINLVVSTIAELDDTPPYFTGDFVMVWGSPMNAPVRYHVEDLH
jgi:hypothetical protein